jgi:transposase
MIRTSTLSLKFSNTGKLESLDRAIQEYKRVVNLYIDILWDHPEGRSFLPKETIKQVDTWLSERLKQCAGKQANQIVKSQTKKHLKQLVKPAYNKDVIELDQRFVSWIEGTSFFDAQVKFTSLGNKIKVICPVKYHRHYNDYKNKGWARKQSARLRLHNNNIYLDVFFEKEFVANNKSKAIGVDMGINKLIVTSDNQHIGTEIYSLMEKIQRKQQGSKAFYRALAERNAYIDLSVKQLPFDSIGTDVMEDIRGIGSGTKKKKKFRKDFRSKYQRWCYARLMLRIRLSSEVSGVHCLTIDPRYTSQTCSKCGFVHKDNRSGELFLCKNCGYTADADYNASRNILKSGCPQQNMVAGNMKTNFGAGVDNVNVCI